MDRNREIDDALGVARSWKNNAVNAGALPPNAPNKLFSFCSSFRVFSLFFHINRIIRSIPTTLRRFQAVRFFISIQCIPWAVSLLPLSQILVSKCIWFVRPSVRQRITKTRPKLAKYLPAAAANTTSKRHEIILFIKQTKYDVRALNTQYSEWTAFHQIHFHPTFVVLRKMCALHFAIHRMLTTRSSEWAPESVFFCFFFSFSAIYVCPISFVSAECWHFSGFVPQEAFFCSSCSVFGVRCSR